MAETWRRDRGPLPQEDDTPTAQWSENLMKSKIPYGEFFQTFRRMIKFRQEFLTDGNRKTNHLLMFFEIQLNLRGKRDLDG